MISIIIPVWNLHELTMFCLETLRINSTGSDYEVIIIDNGSNPPYEFSKNVKLIRNEENLGFPKAVNQGIEIAQGDWICLLNNDVLVTPYWIERLLAHKDYTDIIGPRTNFSCGLQSKAIRWVYNNWEELNEINEKIYTQYKNTRIMVKWLIGFCMMINRRVIDKIGVMDEGFGLGNYEDVDFCIRAGEAGFKLVIAQDVFVHHFGSLTHQELKLDYIKLLNDNKEKFESKWGPEGFDQQLEEE